jgi:hypothetical protein
MHLKKFCIGAALLPYFIISLIVMPACLTKTGEKSCTENLNCADCKCLEDKIYQNCGTLWSNGLIKKTLTGTPGCGLEDITGARGRALKEAEDCFYSKCASRTDCFSYVNCTDCRSLYTRLRDTANTTRAMYACWFASCEQWFRDSCSDCPGFMLVRRE